MNIHKFFFALAILGILALNPNVMPAHAETDGVTFTVNSTADEPDATSGDGLCKSTPSSVCTLRAAVMEANALPGKDTIQLDSATYKITRVGVDDTANNGDFDISEDVIIKGKGISKTTVDADFQDRVFDLLPNTNVEIRDLRIFHGKVEIEVGGGIRSRGTYLSVVDVLFDTNFAGKGGGIFADGVNMSVDRVVMKFNHATTFGGAILFGAESGITATLFLTNSTLFTNYGTAGAGLLNENNAVVLNTTFSSNHSKGAGGGIVNSPANLAWPPAPSIDLSNVTITANVADDDGDVALGGGGIYNHENAVVTIRNSIIAGNKDNYSLASPSKPHDCYGKLTSSGYNLIGNGYACDGITNGVNGDKVGSPASVIDAKFKPYGDYGGPTFLHALEATSPAVDKGNPDGCKDPYTNIISTDQRSYQRHADGGSGTVRCDMGAYEYNATPVIICEKPDLPILDKPRNNSEIKSSTPTLDWRDANCAGRYQITVKRDSARGNIVLEKMVRSSQLKTPTLERGHIYFWRVQACNEKGCRTSRWSAFTVKP